MPRNIIPRILLGVLACAASSASGCGNSAARPVPDRAEAVVEQVLDAWSRGEAADKFADASQPVQASDPDWKAGYRLLSFLSVEARQVQETPPHVHCRVALSLRNRKGRQVDKQVVYDVEMGDKIVIARLPR